ncbi:DNA-binding protein [Fictibacillus macauensis ZFHKF-1]|uniref:DNA-binding protein n=1 Tax=Fictibacillus macauensis ZFHKF-1 TaxID=1196324 RepID=I8AJL9_9BACL|nr:helix-turn-helix transcriptional regulator [Fictibacillus macauensis]EIT85957.1 DNA-binding protein [Fictibacillus macauensis ZFHKF-1]
MERIGRKVRELRISRGYTLRKVGESVDMDYSYLSKVENGKVNPSLELLQTLADFYNVDISYFFIEMPDELRELGVEYVTLSKKAKEKNIDPEVLDRVIDLPQSTILQIINILEDVRGKNDE